MTCLFTNISLINLLPWRRRSLPITVANAKPPIQDSCQAVCRQVTIQTTGRRRRLITPPDSNGWDNCYSDWMFLINASLHLAEHLPQGHLVYWVQIGTSVSRCLTTDTGLVPLHSLLGETHPVLLREKHKDLFRDCHHIRRVTDCTACFPFIIAARSLLPQTSTIITVSRIR